VSPKPARLTSRDKQLIAYLEQRFPVVSRPFEVIAAEFDMDEHTLLEWITDLVDAGHLQNFRPTLEIEVSEE
jgi:DNA-binding Lrp family transcriptional regulator